MHSKQKKTNKHGSLPS